MPLLDCNSPYPIRTNSHEPVLLEYGLGQPTELDAASVRRVAELRRALDWGWSLTPINGKKPFRGEWQKEPALDSHLLLYFATKGNVAVRTGADSGVVVIDDDTPDGSAEALLQLPRTPTVKTGSGHKHHYFACPAERVSNSESKIAEDVDIRGEAGAAALPGSVHPDTGATYEWLPGLSPDDLDFAPFPENVLAMLREPARTAPTALASTVPDSRDLRRLKRYAAKALEKCAAELETARPGTRNGILNRSAFSLGKFVGPGVLERSAVETILAEAATASGLGESEIASTIASGLNAGIRKGGKVEDLLERIGRRDLGPGASSIGEPSEGHDGRIEFELVRGQQSLAVSHSIVALHRKRGGSILMRGDVLVRVGAPPTGSGPKAQVPSSIVTPLDSTGLCDELDQTVSFSRFDLRSFRLQAIDCPEKIAQTILSRGA